MPARGRAKSHEWPDACAVLRDTDIKAILPQVTDIDRTPQRIEYVDLLGGTSPELPRGRL